jgi:hypothetical protein
VEAVHAGGVDGELRPGRFGDPGEIVDVDEGRHQRRPARRQPGDEVLGQTRAVLDGIDSGVDQVGEGFLAEGVDGHPGPGGVGPLDGGPQGIAGPQRGEVALRAVDPVADQLDPAVAA